MKYELYMIDQNAESIEEAARDSIRVMQRCLRELREYFRLHSFERTLDKIIFFKYIKPIYVGRLIYFTEVFNWWNDRPKYEAGYWQQVYWEDKKEKIRTYNKEHVFLIFYLVEKKTWLDTRLFLPESRDQFYHWGIPAELDSFALYDDPQFSTSQDHIAAKLFANCLLDEFCNEQLKTKEKIADFRGGSETTYDVVPLLQQYRSFRSTGNTRALPLHIPRHEHYRLLDKFMNQNLNASSGSAKRRNARMSKRMRRKVRRFLHVWATESRDEESEQTQEKE